MVLPMIPAQHAPDHETQRDSVRFRLIHATPFESSSLLVAVFQML